MSSTLTKGSETGEKQQQLIKGKHQKAVLYHLVSAPTTMRYRKVVFWVMAPISTVTGQLRREPLFGARPWRYIRIWLFSSAFTVFWRTCTASWREKRGGSSSFFGPFAPQNCLRSFAPAQLQNAPHLQIRNLTETDSNLTNLSTTTMAA